MKERYRDFLFILICFTLIFNNIPRPIQMNFIGGPVGNKLVFYPLMIGMLYTAWCNWKYKDMLVHKRELGMFVCVYSVTSLISLVVGLYTYPYWPLVMNGPVEQIEKLPKMIGFLKSHGIDAEPKVLMSVWISIRQIKGLLLDIFWCFGGAYLVYCWYKDDWKTGLKLATYALVASLGVFILYGVIDSMYLYGNEWAKNILVTVNPYLHPILTNNGWWPPLLWKGQLRSVFVEPSHVGNYLGLVFPFLLYYYLKYKQHFCLCLVAVIGFMVVLTKARTAYAMFFGMLVLFMILAFVLVIDSWKKVIAIFVASVIGFYSGIWFLNMSGANVQIKKEITAESAINDNLGSLADPDKRSNGARYALIKCNLRIAAQHPFFGVGSGLGLAYMLDNYTDAERKNREVADWIRRSYRYGVFATGQGLGDAMNEYVTRLAQKGLVGLVVFLTPFCFIIYRLFKMKGYSLERFCLIFVLISSLVAACNGSINWIFAVWVPLGISYALCFSKDVDTNHEKERV